MDRPPVDKPLSLRADLLDPLVSLHWERCNDLPVGIAGANSVWLNNKLYVGGGGIPGGSNAQLLVYTPSEDSWERIPTPTQFYALATYHSQVVLLGGRDPTTHEPANKVWLLEGRSCVPHPTIPDMPVSAALLCAVSSGDYLIVAGGDDGKGGTAVSVFDGQEWCSAQVLPEQLGDLLSAVNGNEWFLSGGRKVCRASLKSLIASAVNPAAARPAVWKRLRDTPHPCSGITWCGGHLLAVGGQDSHDVIMQSVYAYNAQAKVWEHVSDLPGYGCWASSCTVLPTGELLVAGGVDAEQRVLKATIRGPSSALDKPYLKCTAQGEAMRLPDTKCAAPIFGEESKEGDIVSFKWMDSGTEQTFKLRETFSSTWRDLGKKFGFSGEKLRAFATNNRYNPEQCFDEVISNWRSDGSEPREAYPVTWGGLVQALEDVGGVRVKVDKLKIALKKKKALLGKRKHPEYSQSPSSTEATSSPPPHSKLHPTILILQATPPTLPVLKYQHNTCPSHSCLIWHRHTLILHSTTTITLVAIPGPLLQQPTTMMAPVECLPHYTIQPHTLWLLHPRTMAPIIQTTLQMPSIRISPLVVGHSTQTLRLAKISFRHFRPPPSTLAAGPPTSSQPPKQPLNV